jgi:hypothetical protein
VAPLDTSNLIPGEWTDVLNSGYGYDNGRINKNSMPTRVIAADRIDTQWRADSPAVLSGQPANVGPNHDRDQSATALFVDGAVQQVIPTRPEISWKVDAAVDCIRAGYMQNPRLDVFGDLSVQVGGLTPSFRNGPNTRLNVAGGTQDFDDIYAIKSDSIPGIYRLISDDQFEQCGETFLLTLDKQASNIQPSRNYMHITGWPVAARPVNTP